MTDVVFLQEIKIMQYVQISEPKIWEDAGHLPGVGVLLSANERGSGAQRKAAVLTDALRVLDPTKLAEIRSRF